jgi:hypothetical protein
LDISDEFLLIETKETATGTLTVRNGGGGLLKGYVRSRNRALTFEPNQWEGNTQILTYTFNPASAEITPGQTLETLVYISSNGGEAVLPTTIRLTIMAITTREGQVIANVKDFYRYALSYPLQARQIFTDSDFYMLLLTVGYPFIEVYENLHKDANRERAMDNFFILSGLKRKTNLFVPKKTFVYDQSPGDVNKIYGQLMAEKSDRGYYEAPITPETSPSWLTLSANRLISSDFDAENRARINFVIDPMKIRARYARERIFIGNGPDEEDGVVELIFRRPQPLTARLNSESYRYDDKGVIEIYNHTGKDIAVEPFCPDGYIRFGARSYVAGAYYEIPFTVRLSAFMNAGRIFRKTPYMTTFIEVKGSSPGQVYKLRLPVTVGEW